MKIGQSLLDDRGLAWVYIGSRPTSVGTTEHILARVTGDRWPDAVRLYKATKHETIRAKFPAWRSE